MSKASESNTLPAKAPDRMVAKFLIFLKGRLSLDDDKADPEETSEYIRKGVEFKGTNIYILIFAIVIASVGLNVNSTAVIIGAMLVSPLMGPIMGLGLGAGVNDFELIKKSAKNLALMVGISVAASTLYFLISPLSEAQSELLARTTPTIWDVLIALFGGLAGIIAGSRREKSNAIPGVAIATALMPPLCTAGYGLATAQWSYFFGAFYLFTINSVFISVSTLVVVRFLKYPQKQFIDPQTAKRVKRWITVFVIITTLPSLFIAFDLVRKSVFEREAVAFVAENFAFENALVISKTISMKGEKKRIEVALLGEPIAQEVINEIQLKLAETPKLKGTELIVRQGNSAESSMNEAAVLSLRSGIIEDLYKKNEQALQTKEQRIDLLENELFHHRNKEIQLGTIPKEVESVFGRLEKISLSKSAIVDVHNNTSDTITLAYLQFDKSPSKVELKKLSNFLKTRTQSDSVKLILN